MLGKVDVALKTWNPSSVLLDTTYAKRKIALLAAVLGQLSIIGRLLKSAFTVSLGRHPAKHPPAEVYVSPVTAVCQTKRQKTPSSKSYTFSPGAPPLRALCDVVSAMGANFSEESLAAGHRPIPHSVMLNPFQCMTSKEIIRLNMLDKVIIIVPEVTSTIPATCVKALTEMDEKWRRFSFSLAPASHRQSGLNS